MSYFTLSVDFEMFWGVADVKSIESYGKNVEGVWSAIPRMLSLFKRYGVRVTWATVGMLMCRDFDHWKDARPSVLPGYVRKKCSTYNLDDLVKTYPHLFFGRPLVADILDCPGQEIASHTFSHFYCGEVGATPAQFSADLDCAKQIASELGVAFKSIVLPRNQLHAEYLQTLVEAGIQVYRGNQDHWLYRNGDLPTGGLAGRAVRLLDAYLPLSGPQCAQIDVSTSLINVPASHFLRPWSRGLSMLETLRLARLKSAMTHAALSGDVFHLWWHPHNFGVNTEENMTVLELLLQHYQSLRETRGMQSANMGDFAPGALA